MKTAASILTLLLLAVHAPAPASAQKAGRAGDDELVEFFKKKTRNLSSSERKEIHETIQKLATDHPETRQKAREKIVRFGSVSTPFLLEEVLSENHNRARSGLVALGMLKDPESIPFLERELNRPRFLVSSFAALALGKIDEGIESARNIETQQRLIGVVMDGSARDAFDRAAAAIAVARLGPGPDPSPLIRLLEVENDVKVLASTVMALGKLEAKDAYRQIVKLASSSSERVARAAILALGDLGDERAVPFLLGILRSHESQKTLQFGCGAISRFRTSEVGGSLLAFAKRTDISRMSRAVALRALGSQDPNPATRELLLKYAISPSKPAMVRVAAIASIFPYTDDRVQQVLVSLLKDKQPKIRSSATILLAHMKVDAAVPVITKQLSSEDREVAETSALSLAYLLGVDARAHLAKVPERSAAYPFVRNILEGFSRPDWKDYFRGWVGLWLEALGGQSAGLRRNLANEQIYHLFELEGKYLVKGPRRPVGGDRDGGKQRVLSVAQQDLRLWMDHEPYF